MSEVFVSYSHTDQTFVYVLVQFLKSAGVSVWFDKDDLKGGQKWADVIEDEIPSSTIFLTCLSSNALGKRGFFHAEQELAHKAAMSVPSGEIFIMPVRLDDCEIPRQLRQYHVINLGSNDGPLSLIQSLSYALDKKIETSKECCDRLLKKLRDHIGVETASLDNLVDAFKKGLRSPAENVKIVEQIANSSDRRNLQLLSELRGNDFLSFAEHAAIDTAIEAVRVGQMVEDLFETVTSSEKKKIFEMSVFSGDPVKNFALRQLKYWRYINRKNHPQYSEVEEKIIETLYS